MKKSIELLDLEASAMEVYFPLVFWLALKLSETTALDDAVNTLKDIIPLLGLSGMHKFFRMAKQSPLKQHPVIVSALVNRSIEIIRQMDELDSYSFDDEFQHFIEQQPAIESAVIHRCCELIMQMDQEDVDTFIRDEQGLIKKHPAIESSVANRLKAL